MNKCTSIGSSGSGFGCPSDEGEEFKGRYIGVGRMEASMTTDNPDCIEGLPFTDEGRCACGSGCTAIGYAETIFGGPLLVIEKADKEKVEIQKRIHAEFLRTKNK